MRTLFFLLSILCTSNFANAQVLDFDDFTALVAIYEDLGADQIFSDWLNGTIETLVYNDNEIVLIYSEEEGTYRVSELNLSNKGLSGVLPDDINNLDSLSVLNVRNNEIVALPSTLSLSALSSLDLGYNQLTVIPNLDALTSLTELNCEFNALINLPELSSLLNLRVLDCSSNQLVELPELSQNTELELLLCDTNQLTQLPDINNLDSLKKLDCNSNYIGTLPDFSPLTGLQTLNCSNNNLFFKDIIPLLETTLVDTINYAPQRNLRRFDYHITPRQNFSWPFYQEHDNTSPYKYKWTREGASPQHTQHYLFNDLTLSDTGAYSLRVRNADAPDLTIDYPIDLYVYPSDEVPFDTLSLIVVGTDTVGLKTCTCQKEPPSYGLMEVESMIELNNSRQGSNSNVDKDTTEFNFHLRLDPIAPPPSPSITCDRETISSLYGLPLEGDSVKVAVIGTGIAPHDNLVNHFYQIEDTLSNGGAPCIDSGQVAFDYVLDTNTVQKGQEHETHVAGIITENVPANIDLDLIDIKIYADEGSLGGLICAINFAREAGADVINLSLGYTDFGEGPSVALYNVLKKVQDDGIIVVVSAGNGSTNTMFQKRWPGNFVVDNFYETTGDTLKALDNLIVVAALNHNEDSIATYSNYGDLVDIAAPGTEINSTVVIDNRSTYKKLTGTSMAVPYVSRAVAILQASFPALSYKQIIDTLIASGDTIFVDDKPISSNKKLNLQSAIDTLSGIRNEGVDTQPRRIRHNRHVLGDDLVFTLDRGEELFRDVRFEVVNEGIVVAEGYCPLASRIIWDGRLSDGTMLERKNYFLKFWVQNKSVSINPPNIVFKK